MADINAIRTISLAFENPGSMGEDEATIANRYAEKYPYFIPVKYMLAYQKNQADSANPDVLADIYPYLGNWLQLYSFLKGKAFPKTVYELGGTHAHDDEEEKTTYQVDTPEVLAAHPEEPNNYEATVDSQADTGANSNNNWWTEQTDHLSPLAGQPTTNTNELPEEIAAEASELPLAYAAYLGNNEQSTQEASETVAEATETSALTNEPLMNYDIPLFTPPSGEDYFRQQGISVSGEITEDFGSLLHHQPDPAATTADGDKSLMVVMNFTEWLLHFKSKSEKDKSEQEEQKAVKALWQREKLSRALEEEDDEIPQQVFEMAVNSITSEEDLISESLADVYVKQQKYGKAIDMYLKLSLRNPEKNAYFAHKIEEILKEQ